MTRRPRDTREKLFQAAGEMFAEKGFEGARVDAIASRARVNKAMIYYHFRTKKDLYQTVLLDAVTALRKEVEATGRDGPSPADRLGHLVTAIARVAAERPVLPRILLREILADGRHLSPAVARAVTGMLQPLRSAIEDGIARGDFRRVDPILTHINLVASIMLFFASGTFRTKLLSLARADFAPPRPEDFVRQLKDTLIRGLARETEE